MNESKYRTLLETLKKDILGGKYNSGASFPSIRALVSEPTGSEALFLFGCRGIGGKAGGRGVAEERKHWE